MINVMIVDDHKMIREGLKQILEFDGEIHVVDEADNGQECLKKLRSAKPDIILLDINMPVLSGIETLQELKKKRKKYKVLMLTVHNEIEYLLKAVDIGIDGYLLKDSDSAELKRAINTVYNGEKFIQPSLIPLLNSKLIARDLDKEKVERLSNREIEVLKLVELEKFYSKLKNGLETELGEKGILISGGERQRIALARLFFDDSKIIILDEATSAMDNITEEKVMDSIMKKLENKTFIIIAHRLNTIRNVDKIFVLRNGSITDTGTYQSLQKNSEYFKELSLKKVN